MKKISFTQSNEIFLYDFCADAKNLKKFFGVRHKNGLRYMLRPSLFFNSFFGTGSFELVSITAFQSNVLGEVPALQLKTTFKEYLQVLNQHDYETMVFDRMSDMIAWVEQGVEFNKATKAITDDTISSKTINEYPKNNLNKPKNDGWIKKTRIDKIINHTGNKVSNEYWDMASKYW